MLRNYLHLGFILLGSLPSQGQVRPGVPFHPHVTILRDNTLKMACGLSADRDAYLAGEVMTLRLTVSNPTNELIEVFDPFDLSNGGLLLAKKEPALPGTVEGVYRLMSPHPHLGWKGRYVYTEAEARRSATVWLKPGETREVVVNSSEPWFGETMTPWQNGGSPGRAGEYELRFAYCRAAVRFTVVPAVPQAAAFRPTADVVIPGHESGGSVPHATALRAFAFRLGDRSVIAVSKRYRLAVGPQVDTGRALGEAEILSYGPFLRVAEVEGVVTNLAIQQLDDRTYEAIWTGTGGRLLRRSYRPELSQGTLKPREVKIAP